MRMGITFKGIHSDTMGVTVRTKSRPILPEEKERIIDHTTMDGVFDFSSMGESGHSYYNDRIFQSEMLVCANDITELQKNVSRVAAWLKGSGQLIYDDMPYVVWKAKVATSVDFAPKIYGTQAILSVSFRVNTWSESIYDARTLYETPLDSAIPLDSDLKLDMSEYFAFPLKAGLNNIFVENLGTVHVEPILQFTGTSSTLKMLWDTGTMEYTQSFTKLEIDCKQKQVLSNGANANKYLKGAFPQLLEGDNNFIIHVTGDTELFVQYTPRYIYNETVIYKE